MNTPNQSDENNASKTEQAATVTELGKPEPGAATERQGCGSLQRMVRRLVEALNAGLHIAKSDWSATIDEYDAIYLTDGNKIVMLSMKLQGTDPYFAVTACSGVRDGVDADRDSIFGHREARGSEQVSDNVTQGIGDSGGVHVIGNLDEKKPGSPGFVAGGDGVGFGDGGFAVFHSDSDVCSESPNAALSDGANVEKP